MSDLSRRLTGIRANRRAAIRAGLGGGALAAGWSAEAARARHATPAPDLPSSAWTDLASRLSGRLLLPDDPGYPQAAWINAARYADEAPAAVAAVASQEDVAACLNWARETGAPFAVKSGGHSYAGFSTSSGGLVIDMRALSAVTRGPEDGTMTVQGGAIGALVGNAIKEQGAYFPGSRCPAVGVTGVTLGGGWGFSCRLLGLTCDNLLSTEVVTAGGELVVASESENPDLFWAFRGGAGGSFGVNTSLTYRTTPTRDVTFIRMRWTGGKTGEVLEALLRMQIDAPREFGVRTSVRSTSRTPASGAAPLELDVLGLHWGPPSEAEEILRPVERIQAASERTVEGKTFPDAHVSLYGGAPAGRFQVKSGFVRGVMPADGLAEALSWVERMPGAESTPPDSAMVFYCWGGAVNDPAPDAMAFPYRDADFMWLCEAQWGADDDPGLIAENIAWNQAFHDAMQPWLTGGVYANFPDRTQQGWARAYWGDNLPRLSAVKRAWDPDNLFRFLQSVPPEA